jgi:hypothetical protein
MLKQKVIEIMKEVAESFDVELVAVLNDNTVLLESGLDSLAFAILVTRLEEDLGYDPFVLMDEPIYPRTIGDFVAIYDRYKR